MYLLVVGTAVATCSTSWLAGLLLAAWLAALAGCLAGWRPAGRRVKSLSINTYIRSLHGSRLLQQLQQAGGWWKTTVGPRSAASFVTALRRLPAGCAAQRAARGLAFALAQLTDGDPPEQRIAARLQASQHRPGPTRAGCAVW